MQYAIITIIILLAWIGLSAVVWAALYGLWVLGGW